MSQRTTQVSALTGISRPGKSAWRSALARDIVDGERIISGAHTEISFAAAMLAQKMHAPNIKLQLGGTCFLVNVSDLPVRLPKTSTEYRMIRWAEIAYDHMETFMYFGAPGGRAYYTGGRPPTNKYFVGDKFFAGGIQVDGNGNANMIGLKGEGGRRFSFRGPGTVGIRGYRDRRDALHFCHASRQAHAGRAGRLHLHARAQWLARQQISRPRTEMDHHAARDLHIQQRGARAACRRVRRHHQRVGERQHRLCFRIGAGFFRSDGADRGRASVLRHEIDPDGVLRH